MTKYHFTGIKGSGMSSLAQVLDDMGYKVQGSDVETYYFTQEPLDHRGIKIYPFSAHNITEDLCIIAGNAFNEEHIEIKECIKRGIPYFRYHNFLGEFAQGFTSIAVTGAHGKTSTTGLLAHVLKAFEPTTFLIGDGTGKGTPESKYFVFEACEYKRHFLAYKPNYAILTNIDFDHPDYFKGIEDVCQAFEQFVSQVQKRVVACGDNDHVRQLKLNKPMLLYGIEDHNDLQAYDIRADKHGMHFSVKINGKRLGRFFIPLHGRHNVLNALAVIGIMILEGVDLKLVQAQFNTFSGVKRRFYEQPLLSNVMIDDYAHHPTEITATLEAVRSKYPEKRLVSVFQPHTYTRTATFLEEFAKALAEADEVYLCDIFGSAREQKQTLSIHNLLEKIPSSRFISEESIDQLHNYTDSVILFMGAGDIQKLQAAYVNSVTTADQSLV